MPRFFQNNFKTNKPHPLNTKNTTKHKYKTSQITKNITKKIHHTTQKTSHTTKIHPTQTPPPPTSIPKRNFRWVTPVKSKDFSEIVAKGRKQGIQAKIWM